jgi:hypothetical protein
MTGIAIAALVAGGASATVHKKLHNSRGASASAYATPPQPIPYAQLDSYLNASPRERASMDLSSGSSAAATDQAGATPGADQSAGRSATSSDPGAASTMAPPTEDAGKLGSTEPGSPGPPSDSSTTPPK